jgi:uncharacterized tellurite resistance protein B-like protein
MSIREWLGLGRASRADDGDVIHRIVRDLEALDPAAARYLALFAFLLARVANVDQDVSAEETEAMERLVETYGGLPAAQAALVVQVAKVQNLLHCLFAVCASDETITVAEEELVRSISRELLLTNDEYLAIRSAYRDKRAVLRR